VRWDALFDDLEAQAAALSALERAAEIADRSRFEAGTLRLYDRARASLGSPLRVQLAGGFVVHGQLLRCGADWLLLGDAHGAESVIVTAHATVLRGFGHASGAPGSASAVESRIGLRAVLRGIARERCAVQIRLSDASTVAATIERAGRDYVEVAVHAPGERRLLPGRGDVRLLPLPALAAVFMSA
jgi:hypothetical protein